MLWTNLMTQISICHENRCFVANLELQMRRDRKEGEERRERKEKKRREEEED